MMVVLAQATVSVLAASLKRACNIMKFPEINTYTVLFPLHLD